MAGRHSGMHSVQYRVQWNETDRVSEVCDCIIRIAAPDPHETGEEPGSRQIGIERLRPVEQDDAAIEVAGEMGESMAGPRQRDRIVHAELDGAAGEPRPLDDLAGSIDEPAIGLAPEVAP